MAGVTAGVSALLDQAERDRAIEERERNVLVEASAGTGKTMLLVERLLSLLAPSDGCAPVPIDRIAAITFTRKAAGELAARVRQRILDELARETPGNSRAQALSGALAGLDTAHIGTIHGFANRLLRKWPAEARLDPRYVLDEDGDLTLAEAFDGLLGMAEGRTLPGLARDVADGALADQAVAAIRDARTAGLLVRSVVGDGWRKNGLDALFSGFALHRDVATPEIHAEELDRAALAHHIDEYAELTCRLSGASRGARWLVDTNDVLQQALREPDPAVLYREVVERLQRGPTGKSGDKPRRGLDFDDDALAWDAWRAFAGDDRVRPVRARPLRDDLLAPLRRWLALRLVRTRSAALHVYELVKTRKQVVDHVDLLMRLRDLLRDDRAVRRSCQELFDHVFIDEFQDTDPLQAEIVLFLCEDGAEAASWDAVRVAPGRLTVVGDPKQSIFRFRRADIGAYQRVLEIVERSPVLSIRLSASFRSPPSLVGWLNDRFAQIFGTSGDGAPFRRETGEVFHQPLAIGRPSGPLRPVHVLPLALGRTSAAEARAVESDAIARYVRWLVLHGDTQIADRWTCESRRPSYGDIGVLAMTTTNLPLLFSAFDRDGVPYAARGGELFASDPIHRQFLLGLCALADRDDGVAMAALLRPPFFALDLGDLSRARPDDPDDRVAHARAVIRELRRRRFDRSPGATARALLHDTGFGRMIALGPNGAQRLAQLYELCFQAESRAAREHLDFDGIAARLRDWIDHPPALDPPHPVSDDAVRVLTVHQAKGLELPVVVLWDHRATWREYPSQDAYSVGRDGLGWAMQLDGLRWEDPPGHGLADREAAQLGAERRRLLYVAATRARDILVIPTVRGADRDTILGTLLGTAPSDAVLEQPAHGPGAPAGWYELAGPTPEPTAFEVAARDVELQRAWSDAATVVSRPNRRPRPFASDAGSRSELWAREGRHGTRFGETVHAAIGLVLRGCCAAADAVRRAAARAGLDRHLAEAVADVERALVSLGALGITAGLDSTHLEYPISGLSPSGDLLSGYIDLVSFQEDSILVIDFKTDAAPTVRDPIQPAYRAQVLGYADALASLLEPSGRVRAGLLYTADGGIRWVGERAD